MKTLLLFLLSLLFSCLFFSCENEESGPCSDIQCVNGGSCSSGICSCPGRYEGEFCQRETVPTSITLEDVGISGWSENDNGDAWDQDGGLPDIQVVFCEISPDNEITELITYDAVENAPSDQELIYDPQISMNPDTRYGIKVFDEEAGSRTFMTSVEFVPWDQVVGRGFPEEIDLSVPGELTVKAIFRYKHN